MPMVAYHDHTEHDVDVIATEQGIADIRGITPKERVKAIIENCVHPDFKKAIWDYCNGAVEKTGNTHTPHDIEKSLWWHVYYQKNKMMKQ